MNQPSKSKNDTLSYDLHTKKVQQANYTNIKFQNDILNANMKKFIEIKQSMYEEIKENLNVLRKQNTEISKQKQQLSINVPKGAQLDTMQEMILSMPTSNFKMSGESSLNQKAKAKKQRKGINFECDQEVESLLVATHIQQNSRSSINFNDDVKMNGTIQ